MFWVFGIIICFAEMGFRFKFLKVFDHVLILLWLKQVDKWYYCLILKNVVGMWICSFTYVSVSISLELCFSFAFLMTLSIIGLECVCILLVLHL